ncbi:MAG: SpoIIE family protein phosphatase [Acidobacteriota bacterium]
MKFSFDRYPRLARIVTFSLAALCLYLGAVVFYRVASVPTDENVFMTPPSTAFVAREIPARFIEEAALRFFEPGAAVQTPALLTGDVFIEVNKRRIKTVTDIQEALVSAKEADSLDVFILRGATNRHFYYRVKRTDLDDPSSLREYRNVVLVTSVPAGGASDKAGMKTGDVIYRINEQTFKDAQSADRILRQGQIDKSLRYDIYRGGQTLTLQVTLARFGIAIVTVLFFVTGLFYIGTGLFLGLRRPQLRAARILSWAFIAAGSLLSVIALGRGADEGVYLVIRISMLLWGFYGATTFFALSFFYFPKEKAPLLANPIHHRIIMAMGIILPVITGVTRSEYSLLLAFLPLLYIIGLRLAYRKKLAREHWTMMRGVKWSVVFIVVINIVTGVFSPAFGQFAINMNGINILTLLLVPVAYLFTIGRYQLLEMKLRIRRNLQYSTLSVIWNTALTALLVVIFFSLPDVALPLQNVEFTGASILITDTPVAKDELTRNEKIGSMLLGLGAVFAYVLIRRRGQRYIDEKYYQTQFDYRRALSELSEALAAKLGMNDLAHGLVSTLADLMNVKDASVIFFRNGGECCCIESVGIATPVVTDVCLVHQKELKSVLGGASGASRVDYLTGPLRRELTELGVRIVVPICSKQDVIGALLIGEKLSETAFKDEDISFLNSAAVQASVSIENAFLYEELAEKERMKHELEIARKIQLASLPQQLPTIRGLDIAGGSLPAMEVGGDFFDYLQGKDGSLTVIIGDVSGKGTSAALYMSKVQGILRSLFTFGLTPRDLFIRANRLLCRDLEKRSFVTVLGAEFNMETKTIRIARAGHLPLYCAHAEAGAAEKIISPGIGLGLNDAEQPFAMLEECVRGIAKGEMYIFVSDGITEAQNEAGEEYGEERLMEFIEQHRTLPAMRVRDLLFDDLKKFTNGASQHDDQTIVCISITE